MEGKCGTKESLNGHLKVVKNVTVEEVLRDAHKFAEGVRKFKQQILTVKNGGKEMAKEGKWIKIEKDFQLKLMKLWVLKSAE
jgi:hypothetical protein